MIPTKETTMEESGRAYVAALTQTARERYLENQKQIKKRTNKRFSFAYWYLSALRIYGKNNIRTLSALQDLRRYLFSK